MAYVYRHIRLDKNEPFYIGASSLNDENYERAYNKYRRTSFWKNIAKFGYDVEIIFDDLSWEEAQKKEKEFIKLYGRKNLNNGTLCNLTDGGEGNLNRKHTEEAKIKISEAGKGRTHNIGKKHSIETRIKRSNSLKGIKRSEETKRKLSEFQKGNKNWLGKHHTEESKLKISLKQRGITKEHCCRKIAELNINGDILNKYNSIKEAVQLTNLSLTGIRNVLTGISKTIRKRYFKYI